MRALKAKLEELGPGCRLVHNFAMSVGVLLPNGKMIQLDRNGEVTKG